MVKRPLTEEEMRKVRVAIFTAPEDCNPTTAAISEVFNCLDPAWASAEQIDPTQYAIPNEQTERILRMVYAAVGGAYLSINTTFLWLSIGPGSYDPIIEQQTVAPTKKDENAIKRD